MIIHCKHGLPEEFCSDCRPQAKPQGPTKHCGRCNVVLPIAEFPTTTAYGKAVVRSWCSGCLTGYYRSYKRRKRQARKIMMMRG